jgi:hypothetical protein
MLKEMDEHVHAHSNEQSPNDFPYIPPANPTPEQMERDGADRGTKWINLPLTSLIVSIQALSAWPTYWGRLGF